MTVHFNPRDFYPAIVSRVGPRFEARLVDLPNCIGIGITQAEAEAKALTALAEHAAFRARHDIEMPRPSIVAGAAGEGGDYVVYCEVRAATVRG